MSNILDIPQNFSTTLNVGGGIDNSQTSGIILTSVTGLPTDGGILAIDWASPINTSTIEYVEYGGLSSNTLTGVVRGQEGYSAQTHQNGAKIVGVVSRAHIKRLKDNFTAEHDRSTGAHNTAVVVTLSAVQVLTHKDLTDATNTLPNPLIGYRIRPRTNTIASSATPAINTDTTDIFTITALAAAITSMSSSLTGTPQNGDKLIVRILDNGTARAITWGASFASRGASLPTTTVLSKYLYVGLIWNSTTSTWDCVATAEE